MTQFVALRDLDDTTGDAITWSSHPISEAPGAFRLMIAPPGTTVEGNVQIEDDPHRAFFTMVREVYPVDPVYRISPAGPFIQFQNTTVGKRCAVGWHCSIGNAGFGLGDNDDGSRWRVPHIGRVVIEDDVEIGDNTVINRGCLGDTIIRRGAKIDGHVFIAHNVEVGENAVVVAGAILCGSCVIGAGAWIAAGACIRNGITVGEGATVGLMANVVKDVPPNVTVMGNPARVV